MLPGERKERKKKEGVPGPDPRAAREVGGPKQKENRLWPGVSGGYLPSFLKLLIWKRNKGGAGPVKRASTCPSCR